MTRTALALLCVTVAISGCGAAFRPFAAHPVMWRDDDQRPFGPQPQNLYTPWAGDGLDNALFRQVSRALLYERSHQSVDVNALDEVPDSSWFTNRLSRHDMTAAELERGACADGAAPPTPWVIVQGKFTGTTPGAVIRAADGHKYVLKVDFYGPERDTAGDVISTRILYAAGYDTACDVVTYVAPSSITIDPQARRSRHSHHAFTQEDLGKLLHPAVERSDGARRVSVSRFLDGEPLGGFQFAGTRGDDPNDVVPHEDRRELRGFYVLSAWLNHIDVRAENNFDEWVSTDGTHGYVHHMILDAGDSFGVLWAGDVDDGMGRRFGHAHYFDFEQVSEDLVTLGMADRAYRNVERGPAYEFLGWYDDTYFDPNDWRSGYPNPAFERRTEADSAWMARIIARFREPEVRAVVDAGKISHALWREELVRVLMGRRALILERFLIRLSPLSFPTVEGGHHVCLRDLAVESGIRDAGARTYSAHRYEGMPPRDAGALPVVVENERVCVDLPVSASDETARYSVVDLVAGTRGAETSAPARLHFWQDGHGSYLLAGLERPDEPGAP